jgi:hypothetical protein
LVSVQVTANFAFINPLHVNRLRIRALKFSSTEPDAMKRLLISLCLFLACSQAARAQDSAEPPPEAPFGSALAPAPSWSQLSAPERHALAPLEAQFDQLDSQQRRKWQALARRAERWTAQELRTAQSRMALWAGMTPEQRAAARQQALAARAARGAAAAPKERERSWKAWSSQSPQPAPDAPDVKP